MARWMAVALCLLLPASPALAKKKDKDKDQHGKGTAGVAVDKEAVGVAVGTGTAGVAIGTDARFSVRERDSVRRVFVERHGRGHCPPGLAKKNNGCLPPGQAKKRYSIGHALAPHVVVDPLPRDLRVRIGDPPKGYRYGIVDGDLVKLTVGTALVVDSIDGLVD